MGIKAILLGDAMIPGENFSKAWDKILSSYGTALSGDWESGWDQLQFRRLEVEKHGPEGEIVDELILKKGAGTDMLLGLFVPVSSKVMDAMPQLRIVGVSRAGLENVNVAEATKRGILVFNVQGRNAQAVSDFTIGLMLAAARNIAKAHAAIMSGTWRKTFPNSEYIPEIEGRVVGLVGFGHIGKLVARKLSGFMPEKVHAKIIELDYDRCVQVTEILHDTLVIHGDGRNLDLLKEENIEEMDAFIAVTGSTDANILACLAAKRLGIIKTIAEIENIDYIPLAQSLDIGTIINKKLIAAEYIHQLILNENVLNVKSLTSSDTQMLEFVVRENSKITTANLRNLKLPSAVNFGGYIRNGEGFICSGNTSFQAGDHVILFCFASATQKIETFFH